MPATTLPPASARSEFEAAPTTYHSVSVATKAGYIIKLYQMADRYEADKPALAAKLREDARAACEY